ncbi:uncharacterized protein LOC125754706 [Canis lupus dingo]|uniref:uncharacterized protein LOC125754706 n=1 Tax=Canis lupus dingo TaxID=286419 RepID=UPI0020C4C249|nr:uncharacterized protein LOC125754706 [Canis lupus dingo]
MSHTAQAVGVEGHPAPGSPAGPRHLRRALRRPGLRAASGWRETRSPRVRSKWVTPEPSGHLVFSEQPRLREHLRAKSGAVYPQSRLLPDCGALGDPAPSYFLNLRFTFQPQPRWLHSTRQSRRLPAGHFALMSPFPEPSPTPTSPSLVPVAGVVGSFLSFTSRLNVTSSDEPSLTTQAGVAVSSLSSSPPHVLIAPQDKRLTLPLAACPRCLQQGLAGRGCCMRNCWIDEVSTESGLQVVFPTANSLTPKLNPTWESTAFVEQATMSVGQETFNLKHANNHNHNHNQTTQNPCERRCTDV